MDLDSRTEKRVRLLADSCNRAVLATLDESGGSLHAEELAERLVSDDVAVVRSSRYDDRIERTVLSLHHDRLPRLADAGLIEYDAESNVATHRTAAAPDVEWRGESVIDALVAHLPADYASDEEGVGVLEGRESVLQYGRRLVDEAEEELFCMYVSTDLLEDECLRRAENALERGVTMYIGSRNAEVRDLVRRNLPEATVWEPQLDWLNTPTYPRVGRLVLADRRNVMLAVLDEPTSDGTRPAETAVVGEGEDHSLVVLVRDLLGPRLDHLDYQSDEFRNELPS